MVRSVIMLMGNVILPSLIRMGIFCSMLCILFSPFAMWVYIGISFGYIFGNALYKTIKIYA